MKSLNRLIVLVVIMAGLTLATGVAYAAQLDVHQLANVFTPGAQDLVDVGLRNNDALPKGNSSGSEGDEEIEIIGVVTGITTDTLTLSDTVIAITPETVFEDVVVVGDMVKVEAFYADDGTLTASKVELFEDDQEEVIVTGTVTSITTDTLVVGDTSITITPDTEFEDEVTVGDMVKVKAYFAEDGTLVAIKVELLEDDEEFFEIIGTVTGITTDTLEVDGTAIAITPDTEFEDEVAVGDMVKVTAFYAEDGTLTAHKVELYEDEEEYFKIFGTVTAVTSDTLEVDGVAIAITTDTIFEDEVAVGDMVKVVAFYADDGTLTAHKVSLFEEDGNGHGYGYAQKVKIVGIVESYDMDLIVVSGIPISITADTKIIGTIEVGDVVRVHAFIADDGTLTAWKIKWLPDAVANPGNGDKIMIMGGIVESLTSDTIVVSGIGFAITPETKFTGDVGVGDSVKVIAYYAEDGSLVVSKVILQHGGSGDKSKDDSAGGTDQTSPGNSGGNSQGGGNDNGGGNDTGGGNDKGGGNNKGGNDKGGDKGKGGGKDK